MPSLIETSPESARKERVCPPGAWDTHFHIFELDRFELSPRRHFTPAHTPLADFETFQHKLGIEHPAIAHGLSFGLDISSIYRYLEYFDGTARAFAVIDLETVTDGDLQRMHGAGVRGIRIDYHHHKAQHGLQEQIKCLKAYSARVAPFKWAVQVYHPHPEFWSELAPVVAELPTPVLLDHFGALKTASLANYDQSQTTDFDVLQQPGLDAITTLLRSGKLWLKLSAPYRCSEAGPEYLDMETLVKALVQANPDRVLYGSDWPHKQPFHRRPKNLEPTDIEPFVDFDDYTWVKTLKTWLSEEEWQKLMVKNPRVLMQYDRDD